MAVIVVTRLRHHHLAADGRSATLTDASNAIEARSFPPPVA
jgi:hypothetical protein